jgi:hypothetical protein
MRAELGKLEEKNERLFCSSARSSVSLPLHSMPSKRKRRSKNATQEEDTYVGMTIEFTPPPEETDSSLRRGGGFSQVLPVAELDEDFSGDPIDGSEYLFLVR